MSAVGLMLLEDPKARARAEAKIRAGTAKRRSFFGRSNNAPPPPRQKPNLPPTIQDEEDETDSVIVRPSTSLSQNIALPHIKKSDNGSDRSSSRASMFGRKNSQGDNSSIKSGSSGHVSHLSTSVSTYSREPNSYDGGRRQPVAYPPEPQYHEPQCSCSRQPRPVPQQRYEDEPNQHRARAPHIREQEAPRRQVAPAGVRDHHAAHAARSHLPPLGSVSKNPEPARSRATRTHETPKVHVNGVKTEDWALEGKDVKPEPASNRSRRMSPIDPNPPRIPAAARMSSFFDDSLFTNVAEMPGSDEDKRYAEASRQPHRNAKKFSTMVARNSLMFPEEPIVPTPNDLHKTNPLDSFDEHPQASELYKSKPMPQPPAQKMVYEEAASPEHQALSYRSRQQSLPVPDQKPSKKSSETSLASKSSASRMKAPLEPVTERAVTTSVSPSRPTESSGKSPAALSFNSKVRESTVFEDGSWEDAIDFAYDEEADATCDFDWDTKERNQVKSYRSDEGPRISQSSFDARVTSVYSDGFRDSRMQKRDSTMDDYKSNEHSRRSVGHRGFAAARNSNGDKLAASVKLARLSIPEAKQSQEDSSSPIDSTNGSDDQTPKSPLSPGNIEFPMPPGGGDALSFPLPPGSEDPLDFPMPPTGHRNSDSDLSESGASQRSSRHRKSSSYGSYESYKRASTAPSTAPSSGTSARDTGRWSLTSASSVPSVPSLIQNHLKRASSVSKSMISPPLETLIADEERSMAGADERFLPQTLQFSERESLVMRRPRTSGDRRLLQAAGRAVQRYRPTTPNGSGRGVTTAPEWI